MARIGFNAKHLVSESAGMGVYIKNFLNNLPTNSYDTYVLFIPAEFRKTPLPSQISTNKHIEIHYINSFLSWTHAGLPWGVFKFKIDALFIPELTMPVLTSFLVKNIVMVHGLEFLTNTNVNLFRKLLSLCILIWVSVFAKKIVVPSNSVKQNILKIIKIPNVNEKIMVVHEGPGNEILQNSSNDSNILQKYNLETQYIISVSTIIPRKNFDTLIKAFNELIKHNEYKEYKLVIAGKFGWDYERTLKLPETLGIKENVIFTNWVSDKVLDSLIRNSKCFAFISHDEGFSLSPMEALKRQVPIVLSDIPIHREIYGQNQIFVNKDDIASIKEGIVSAIKDQKKSDYSVCDTYSWKKTTTQVLDIISNCLK